MSSLLEELNALRRLNAPKPPTRVEIDLLASAARRWANRLSRG